MEDHDSNPLQISTNPNGEHLYEDIIPSLPNDLALFCLTKLSHGYHGILQCVSKSWRVALKSTQFFNLKAKQGSCGNWLFVLTEDSLCWEAYDPQANKWHPLPLMPSPKPDFNHHGFSCVTLSNMFLVFGGYYAPSPSVHDATYRFHCTTETENVLLFDPFRMSWRIAANMRNARSYFACAAIDGKVYVAGGKCMTEGLASAEVYDPTLNRWEDLPPMPVSLMDCFSISYGGKFHVLGKVDKCQHLHNVHIVFDPSKREWELLSDVRPLDRLERQATVVQGDKIFTVDEGDLTFKLFDVHEKTWASLGRLPSLVRLDHNRALHTFQNGFLELDGKFYFFGGKAVRYDAAILEFVVVKLNIVRFCDPSNSLLSWGEARPMFLSHGAVLGCASMRDESQSSS